jgi:DNA-binding GntR family transcriptional regulator
MRDSSEQSLADRVHDELREQIITGRLTPGQRLLERELSAEFGVSRIPLREALPRLEAEGFVTVLPRRGAVVSTVEVRDLEELFDVWVSLDTLAAQQAARKTTERTSARIVAALARAERATANGSARRVALANSALHEVIYEIADNRLLDRLMGPVNGRIRWLFRLTDRDPHRLCAEHRKLCAAIVAGDADLAGRLATEHVEAGREFSIAAMKRVRPQLVR